MRVLIICICLSVPTNNETVNLILIQKHVVDEKYNVAIQYGNYFITIKVAGSVNKFCVRVMCMRESIKAARICIKWSPTLPMFKTWPCLKLLPK